MSKPQAGAEAHHSSLAARDLSSSWATPQSIQTASGTFPSLVLSKPSRFEFWFSAQENTIVKY